MLKKLSYVLYVHCLNITTVDYISDIQQKFQGVQYILYFDEVVGIKSEIYRKQSMQDPAYSKCFFA